MDDDTTTSPHPKRSNMASSSTGVEAITVVGKATNTNTTTNLTDLIDPILRNISTYLSNADLMTVARVSKHTHSIISRATR